MNKKTFYASGKLLLFGEYLVLRGCRALAMPLSFGQTLTVSASKKRDDILWNCFERGKPWLKITFTRDFVLKDTTDSDKTEMVQNLLMHIKNLKPELFSPGLHLSFDLDFNRQYGFGTSSTLISLLSQWSGVDPYLLLYYSSKSSGYDVAAATSEGPFLYNLSERLMENVTLSKDITNHLLFIYSGKKQNSAEEIKKFEQIPTDLFQLGRMDELVKIASRSESIEHWENLIEESNQMIGQILGEPPILDTHFEDYPYQIKSLGAWGGDFFMVTCRNSKKAIAYFEKKGFNTIYTYSDLAK